MFRRVSALVLALLSAGIPLGSHAASTFTSDTTIGGSTFTGLSYDSAEGLVLSVTSQHLLSLLPGYGGNELVSLVGSYRGVPISIGIPNGSSEVSLFMDLGGGTHISRFFNTGDRKSVV